ncbi:hypothetical protein QQ045_004622 [Rhodiola kirilowii]
MADQPVPRSDFERVYGGFTATLAALTSQMAAMSTQLTEVDNKSYRGDRREELNRVPQGENNRATIFYSLSSKKKVDYGDQQNNYDYQVKSDIPLFFGSMGGQEFLNWQVEVDELFDVMGVPKNIQVKMAAMRLKSVASVWWDKLVIQRQRERKVPIRSWR